MPECQLCVRNVRLAVVGSECIQHRDGERRTAGLARSCRGPQRKVRGQVVMNFPGRVASRGRASETSQKVERSGGLGLQGLFHPFAAKACEATVLTGRSQPQPVTAPCAVAHDTSALGQLSGVHNHGAEHIRFH